MKRIIIFVYILIIYNITQLSGQDTKDFSIYIGKYDFSTLWTTTCAIMFDNIDTINIPEPLGFIDEDFQRFRIHFISVIQNKEKPCEYFVYGKTKVKNNICDFQGIITITYAETFTEPDVESVTQGFAKGNYQFFENNHQSHAGRFYGTFLSSFMLDDNDVLQYNAIGLDYDGYGNNSFTGVWQDYSTGKIKTCNWGDFRIPESGDLDNGAAEFSVNEKYIKNGWQDFSWKREAWWK